MSPVDSCTRIWNDSSTDSSVGGAICANCGFISVWRSEKSTPTSSDHEVDSSRSRRSMKVRDSCSSMSVSSRRRGDPWPGPAEDAVDHREHERQVEGEDGVGLEGREVEDAGQRRHGQRRDELAVGHLLGAEHRDLRDGAQRAGEVRAAEARERLVQHLQCPQLVAVELRLPAEVDVLHLLGEPIGPLVTARRLLRDGGEQRVDLGLREGVLAAHGLEVPGGLADAADEHLARRDAHLDRSGRWSRPCPVRARGCGTP